MNKLTTFFLLCGSIVLSIHSEKPENSQLQDYASAEKKSQKKPRRLARKQDSAAPVLKKEEAKVITMLDQTCKEPIYHFTQASTEPDKTLCLFLKRIEFSRSGIATFFSQTFNRREYGTEFLPHNFGHLAQFMTYGHSSQQPHEYFDGVIRLFGTKLKATSCVNSAAFEGMMNSVTPQLAKLFLDKKSLWKDIKKLLWSNFKDRFSFLQSKPMDFFEDISDQILQQIKIQVTTPEKLRSTTIRFVGSGIDKLAWCPEDQEATWTSFKTIGQQLTTMYEKDIIDDPFDLNELYWGLIERYCYFLELAGPTIALDVCMKMKNDVLSGNLPWLKTEEQEEGIETKTERLMLAIIETEAKIHLFKHEKPREFFPVQQTTRSLTK